MRTRLDFYYSPSVWRIGNLCSFGNVNIALDLEVFSADLLLPDRSYLHSLVVSILLKYYSKIKKN